MKTIKNELAVWKPTNNLPSIMFVEALHDDYEGLRILLKGEDVNSSMLRIRFPDFLSYRNTNESFLLDIWHSNQKAILGKTFYLVNHSSYKDFFHEMTKGLYSDWQMKHYAIYTATDCIEILTQTEPIVEWLNS